MSSDILKKSLLLLLSLATLPVFVVIFWRALDTESTLPAFTAKAEKAGEAMLSDLRSLPAKEIKEEKESFIIEEDGKDGIDISFASSAVIASESSSAAIQDSEEKPKTTISLPKDYGKPIEVRLDEQRIVLITDLNGSEDYEAGILTDESPSSRGSEATAAIQEKSIAKDWIATLFRQNGPARNDESGSSVSKYLAYTSPDGRTTHLYAYQKDQATGERKLKSWTLYGYGLGKETESYRIENAKVKIDDDGNADVFFFGQSDIQSEQAKADVDPNLMDRAQKFLREETGNDIMNDTDRTPDFTIPKPTYFTKDGVEHEAEWNVILSESEGSRDSSASLGMASSSVVLTVSLTENPDLYPIALDPTLSFTAPGSTTSGGVISGESSSYFGTSFASGDFNADGKMDLAVGASGYSSNTGRIYVFYQDGSYSVAAKDADVIITGEASNNYFGYALAVGDFNTDGKTDLATGGYRYSSDAGRVYIFYNDGSYPAAASGAEVTITEAAGSYYFGYALAAGDFNADGKTDLATGESGYNTTPVTEAGWVRIFYNDGTYPTAASSADVTITAQSSYSQFSDFLASGDFNADGKTDLAVGAPGFNSAGSNSGRSYIFYNDGSYPASADSADVFISAQTGEDQLGRVSSADLNADGKTDLIVTSTEYTSYSDTGRVYVFYSDGTNNYGTATCSGTPAACSAANADVFITGESSNGYFGASLSPGDFNSDGKIDLAVGAYGITTNTGRAYIFYNDGSYPTAAASADVIITGEAASNYFGSSLSSGDFNQDGKTDLAVGAYGYSSSAGRTYIFYSQNGQVNTNKSIAGESTNQDFGRSFAAGDFNADGEIDLAVGAENYDTGSSNVGRVYIFYNDGSYPTGNASADAIITGEAASDFFGSAISVGDFNADGKTDLAVGAYGYSTSTGRAYVFYNGSITTENASGADIVITGEAGSDAFGKRISSGDLNADGKTDLVVGASGYSSSSGRIYVFNNDGSYPTGAGSADTLITGASNKRIGGAGLLTADLNADGKIDLAAGSTDPGGGWSYVHIFYDDGSYPTGVGSSDVTISDDLTQDFGSTLSAGDFNADGRVDIAVGGTYYSGGSYGHAFIFWNDGSYPTTRTSADINIRAETTSDSFGQSLAAGDFNADGKVDLAVGAYGVTTNTGKTYIFHNDGSYPTGAAAADVIITGETTSNYFGAAMVSGDFNADGRVDLVVGAYGNTTNTGKVYFYETRENFAWEVQPVSGLRTSPNFSGQEMKITGEVGTTLAFGRSFAAGDFNADGKIDLAVGANVSTGRTYIFYNDGSITSGAASADVIMTGEAGFMGSSEQILTSGDWNADGKTDLAVANYQVDTVSGRVYILYNDGSYPGSVVTGADVVITGQSNGWFGTSFTAGDFNADGKTDLAVAAAGYGTYAGRAYVFYADGTNNFGTAACSGTPTICLAANADVIIDGGEGTYSYFGGSIVSGDFNVDGKTDLAVGAYWYVSNGATGRVYIFYNDGTYPANGTSADAIITGQTTVNDFGYLLSAGDFNADGKMDLAVSADKYSTQTGRVYIFYADGTNNFGTTTCSGTPAACSAANADVFITGEGTNQYFGQSLVAGDFNGDGKTDLAVGTPAHSSSTGRAYVFYNDGSYPTAAASADLILQGETTSNYYGYALAAGDFNADGKTDLVVGAYGYGSNKGRAYLYTFNDGVITGEATNNSFGYSIAAGDFNADGRTDLVVGASDYSTNTGRAYLFYNDGLNYPTSGAGADVIITGEATSNSFGSALAFGDFNADGKTDLVVGARSYSTFTGRAYIFYNDGSYPTAAASADVIITGESMSNDFGDSFSSGDFNADGKTDLAVGAWGYGTFSGCTYIFYQDGSYPTAAASADIIITGEAATNYFGGSLSSGDFNADGKIDLAAGASYHSTQTGRVYVFYNDGSYPSAAASADVIITGETTDNRFGDSLSSGDFNQDGKTDLAVGANRYSSYTGRAYIFYNDGSYPTAAASADAIITGEATNNYFGDSLASGDFNQDGKIDFVVSAHRYSSSAGCAYIFYNDGSIPSAAVSADAIITGETSSYFGWSLSSGDFNADGKIDLAVGAYVYSSSTGRVHIFITEARSVFDDQTLKVKGTFKTKGGFRVR